jgi:hypothetical protein
MKNKIDIPVKRSFVLIHQHFVTNEQFLTNKIAMIVAKAIYQKAYLKRNQQ